MASNEDVKFREVADRLDKQIKDAQRESDLSWLTISVKETTISSLYIEQIKVSDKFSQYYELLTRSRQSDPSISEDIARFHRFNEIDENVRRFEDQLDDFEIRLKSSGKIIREQIKNMEEYFRRLGTSLGKLMKARTMADLEQVEVHSLEWLQTVPDVDVDILGEEWEQLKLSENISECYQQLEQLVLTHST